MSAVPFTVTVLRAKGRRRLVKLFTADGRKLGTEKAALFHYEPLVCRTPRDFFAGLPELERRSDSCIIRAAPGRWFPTDGRPVYRLSDPQRAYTDDGGDGRRVLPDEVRKKKREAEVGTTLLDTVMLPMFEAAPTAWGLFDIDGAEYEPDWRDRLDETADWLKLRLPDAFADSSCWYQATSSAADPRLPDLGGAAVRMRLGFVLSRELTHDQLVAWLRGIPGLDPSTLRRNQEIYLARPVFTDGLVDPMPVRSGVLEGLEDVVQVPDDLPEPRPRRATIAFVPAAGALGAEGLGLLDCPAFDRALDEIDGSPGCVRDRLGRAAWIYGMGVGPAAVDVAALAARLAEVGLRHRSPDEVDGYGLDRLVQLKLEQAAGRKAEEERQAAEGAAIFANMEASRAPPPPPPPHWPAQELEPDEASGRLRAAVRGAVAAAVAWKENDGDPPVWGIKASAGSGKTVKVLEELAALTSPVETWFFVPTVALAAEAAAKARALGLNAQVIRGREAVVGDEPLCAKHEEARIVARAGHPVMKLLCRRKVKKTGEVMKCPFHDTCRYLGQFDATAPAVRFFAHEYLWTPSPAGLPKPRLIVIDEAFALGAARHCSFGLDRLTSPRVGMPVEREALIHDTAVKVRDLFESGGDPRTAATAETFVLMADAEDELSSDEFVWPSLNWDEQKRRLATLRKNERSKLAATWRVLAKEAGRDAPLQRAELRRDEPTSNGELQDRLHLWWRAKLRLPLAPVLVLDASLDERLVSKLLPGIEVETIAVRRNAEIVQVVDTACSRNRLLSFDTAPGGERQRAANRLADVRHHAEVEARRGPTVLVTYKAAEERLGAIPGVDVTHFGALRGIDRFKDHGTIDIAGREQPSPAGGTTPTGRYKLGVEDYGRSLFGDDDEPLALSGAFVTEVRGYRMRDGSRRAVAVAVHADPRCQAVLEQIRERETEQAIDRLRLVHRPEPARVFLYSNVPLDVTVDKLVTWNELIPDRLTVAAVRLDGVLPLAPAWLAERCPDLWPTAEAARVGAKRAGLIGHSPNRDLYLGNVLLTPVLYRVQGQRGPTPSRALIRSDHPSPEAALAAWVGPLVMFQAEPAAEPESEPPPAPPATPPVAKVRFDVPEPGEPAAARALLAEQPPRTGRRPTFRRDDDDDVAPCAPFRPAAIRLPIVPARPPPRWPPPPPPPVHERASPMGEAKQRRLAERAATLRTEAEADLEAFRRAQVSGRKLVSVEIMPIEDAIAHPVAGPTALKAVVASGYSALGAGDMICDCQLCACRFGPERRPVAAVLVAFGRPDLATVGLVCAICAARGDDELRGLMAEAVRRDFLGGGDAEVVPPCAFAPGGSA